MSISLDSFYQFGSRILQNLKAGTCYLGKMVTHKSKCDQDELLNAATTKHIHDLIEEVAYNAFAEIVTDLNIHEDAITEEQSGCILAHIKKMAHIQMYRKDGYIAMRGKFLNQTQIQKVMSAVGYIVHDRDTKLTNACYYSLTDLLLALDDHNNMVKEILLGSWFKTEGFQDPEHEHLHEIKKRIQFYEKLSGTLSFDIRANLQHTKEFWDKYFPKIRQSCERSQDFVKILQVRHFVQSEELNHLHESDLVEKHLPCELFIPREVKNFVRCKTMECAPLIDLSMTVGEFKKHFFPELGEQAAAA